MQTKKVQSHYQSPQELRDLQIDQVNGEQKKITANKDSSIEINAADRHMVHAEIEARQFNPVTGEKESIPIIQSFYQHEFDTMEQQSAFSGKSVRIVHTPEKYDAKDIASVDPNVQASGIQGVGQAPNVNADPAIITGGPAIEGLGGINTDAMLGVKPAAEKPISRMNKAELKAEYKRLYSEDPQDMTNPELVSAIQDKYDDIEASKKGDDNQSQA